MVHIKKLKKKKNKETNPIGALISDFQTPELWSTEFLLFKPPSWESLGQQGAQTSQS